MRDRQHKTSPKALGGNARENGGVRHTSDHVTCPACLEETLLLVQLDSDFSRQTFSRAAELWMELRKQSRLKQRTHESNLGYINALKKFFGALKLCDISAGHIRSYQLARERNPVISIGPCGEEIRDWHRPAGHSLINHELSCLAQILEHCGLWKRLRPYYFPLGVPKWSPRDILSEEDEEQLFSVAASHPEAQLAYWVACITNNTTAAGCELRGLRLKNIFLREGGEISEIYVPEDAVKNDSRPRKIPLNRTAKWAVEQCYRRALKLGSCSPEHYLFPFRVNRKTWEPSRPASRWFLRNSWDKLRAATGFQSLNPHDLRHQCITRMLERGEDPETVRAIAGHVTEQMMQYYSHIRRQAKYAAVMAIELNERDRVRPRLRAVKSA